MKYILHVDINSFFASVEELNHPSFKNKPIAVSGYTKRSVVCSANYIAREYGIKAAMPVFLAQKLCPGLTVVVPHFDQYHKYSERFTKFISEKFTNKIELGSIDECYVNITSLIDENHSPIQIAENLQKWIKNAIGLNCSIGIANNKFLAKMASDYKKPLGITTLWQNEISLKLWPQPIENMLWIGKATADLLKRNGIITIGDIAKKANLEKIKVLLNKNWLSHHQHANGIGDDQLDYSRNTPKSIGASETFLNDTADFMEIKLKLEELTHDVIARLHYHQQKAKTVSVIIKDTNFQQYSRSITFNKYVDDYDQIIVALIKLFESNFLQVVIRLVGVSLSNLIENKFLNITSELFDDFQKNDFKVEKTLQEKIAEQINEKFSKDIIGIAKNKLTSN